MLSILTFFIMGHGFIISQFVLKSCHLLVYQSNDQGGWMSPCETTKENGCDGTELLSTKKSNK